jgi:predicted nucleotidyltransferase
MKEKMDQYLTYWRDRIEKQQVHNQRLMQQARADVDQIVSLLIDEFDVLRIILFGSLANGTFIADSDIDQQAQLESSPS